MPGPTYLEIPAADPKASSEFYAQVFGWKIDHRGGNDYRFQADGFIGRWLVGRPAAPVDSGVMVYLFLEGDTVDAAAGRAAERGGAVAKAPYTEGDTRVAQVKDPAGNVIGLWQFAGR